MPTEPLFKELKILKIKDNIFLQNCLFVHDYFHGNLPKSFNNTFTKVENTHTSFTRNACDGNIAIPSYNSTNYGLNSIYKHCFDAWNKLTYEQKIIDKAKKQLNKEHVTSNLHSMSRPQLKHLIINYLIETYHSELT